MTLPPTSIADRIARAQPAFSRTQHRMAEYVLAHQFRVATMTIDEFAVAVGVSVATANRFARVLEQVSGVAVTNLEPMPEQGEALRFVHFVDKVYDLGLSAAFTGVPLNALFDDIYRNGGYAKKYSRALSRLSEMLREARG